MGSKEFVEARIESDTKAKTEEMNQTVATHKDSVSKSKINRKKK